MKDFKKKTAFFPYIDQETMTFFSDVGFDVMYQEHDQYAADVMVFTGGPDVTPFLYGQKKIKGTNCDPIRDLKERQVINSVDVSMPKIGICRGAQFLNVYNGGLDVMRLVLCAGRNSLVQTLNSRYPEDFA